MDQHLIEIKCICWNSQETTTCAFLLAPHTTKCLQRNERKFQDLERVQSHCPEHSIVQSAISGCIKTAQFIQTPLDEDVTHVQKIFKNLRKLERSEG
jgi:hypothetical protein